jgi:hypothetical protein
MFKSFLIFINIIGFLIFTILNVNDIVSSHKVLKDGKPVENPVKIGNNQDTEVKIIIEKNDFSGPGRLRLDFSSAEGIVVKEKRNDGSSFTFKNNEALFIWYDLPNEKNIEITYVISANENVTGMKKIIGDFSFINDNERKQLELDDLIFEVDPNIKIEEKEDVLINNIASVKSLRFIDKVDSGYVVTINTTIKNHKGFARIKDQLPLNASALAIETDGAVFKNIDGYAKFIWSEIPENKENITVKYQIVNTTSIDTSFSLYGVYSSEKLISEGFNNGIPIDTTTYNPLLENLIVETISDNVAIEEKTEPDVITENLEIAEKIDSGKEVNPKLPIEEEIINENELSDSSIKEVTDETEEKLKNKTTIEAEVKTIVKNVITSKKINTNVQYKVQILAGHKIVSSDYIAKKFNFKESYDIESHLGWIKYTVGSHSEYKEARNARNIISKKDFPGPFISAYNYGERISVQEALIVSKQNWIP